MFALLMLVEFLVTVVDNFFPQYSIYAPNGYYKMISYKICSHTSMCISYWLESFAVFFCHTIFVQCHKISSICVCDLIIEMKARLFEPLASFASNTNKLYILRHCINIALILLKNHIYPSTFIFQIK